MILKENILTTIYGFYNKCFLYYYCFNITDGLKKGFGFLFLLYLFSFFVEISFCEYSVEYRENDHEIDSTYNQLSTQKKYNLSELASTELPRSEEGERFTPQQKKLLIFAAILGVSVVALFLIMNAENNDLQKKVKYLEKKAAILAAELAKSSSTGEWQRPKDWQYGFGF